ncbi:MAG: hypothetical protein ACXW3D_05025 [Caulobacteraceae bacterium]
MLATAHETHMLGTFIDKVADPKLGGLSPGKMGSELKMSVGELSRLTRLHRNTLTQTPQSPAVQARVGEVARIVAAASEVLGDDTRAIVWFRHQPISGFDGQTAQELVAEGHGGAVLKHLEMLADGVYA